jgi:hypothetical protein
MNFEAMLPLSKKNIALLMELSIFAKKGGFRATWRVSSSIR